MTQQPARLPAEELQALLKAQKPRKYRNEPTTDADGITHASKKQARRWRRLVFLRDQGIITDLRREVRYPLHAPGGIKVCDYIADHTYLEDGVPIVEDVKSEPTRKNAVYRLKKRFLKAEYGIEIREA